ncbi:MAG: MBL fold metallo-hydrolase [Candidatus Fermentibacteraceae bacterium]|nr:MBL fold metallo-hydrolase [Candidatus Fermentibacteraceae bacterium]
MNKRPPIIIDRILTGPIDVNCYIIGCPVSGTAAVIDPGGHGERILERLEHNKLTPVVIINTHGHFDHVGGNAYLTRETDADLLLHVADLHFLQGSREHADMWGMEFEDSPEPTRLLKGGEVLSVGEMELEILHTPGHSPGGISIYIPGHVFTGDALFEGSIGRTDLAGGNFDELISSIREKLLVLPGETIVHPGHGPETTIEDEKRYNMFLR